MRVDKNWGTAIVRAVRDLTPGIREITLAPERGAGAYPTGSHLPVRVLTDGRIDIRHYSLIGDEPVDGCWRIAVKREDPGRGGSRYMWTLQPGARLETTQPDSHFNLSRDAEAYLLIAGGIGVTPILGMAMALARRGALFRLLFAGRSRDQMAYLPELQAICGDRLQLFLDADGQQIDLAAEFAKLPPGGEAYVCGPIGMLEAARRIWDTTGRRRSRLLFETFGSSGRFASEAFTVKVPRLKVEIEVPQNTSMLVALENAGVEVLYDCRRGECGLCVMEILDVDGTVDHRDVFLSSEQHAENRKMCACVSRVVGGSVTVDAAWRPDVALTSGPEVSVQA